MKIRITCLILTLLIQYGCLAQEWPVVRQSTGEVPYNNPDEAKFESMISDLNGKPVYRLSCQTGEMEMEDNSFNYSGLFHCRLISLYSEERVSTLLAEDEKQTADWEGRGRFMLGHVVGVCANEPDWGNKRTFKLRNMSIELSVNDVRLKSTGNEFVVESFAFKYDVKPDPSASTSLTKQSLIPEPIWFAGGGNDCVKEAVSQRH